MEDRPAADDGLLEVGAVEEVAGDLLDGVRAREAGRRGEPVEGAHPLPARGERVHEVRTEEPVRPDDQERVSPESRTVHDVLRSPDG